MRHYLEGTYSERLEADTADCWDKITASDIVYFTGTKIIGHSPDWSGDEIPILDDPADGHGSAVTGAVLDANPDAIIFFVEGFSTNAVLAAAQQPLVDVLQHHSVPPVLSCSRYRNCYSRGSCSQMKIHTGAADNSPSPAVQDATAGPPWSIGIAGYAEGGDDQKEICRFLSRHLCRLDSSFTKPPRYRWLS